MLHFHFKGCFARVLKGCFDFCPFPVKQWHEVLQHSYVLHFFPSLIAIAIFPLTLSSNYVASGLMQTKFSHLDIDGRPVVVLEKTNVVQEHSQYFQVLL